MGRNIHIIYYSTGKKACMPKIVESAGIHHRRHFSEAVEQKGEDDQSTVT
jgi:hypothetical protein